MKRFICIHGHFYQPPRENPYFEEVFKQKGAYPFHDWNERIYRESYLPNTASRILDENGRIYEIRNNYKYLSFNFGPTLIFWIKKSHPELISILKEVDGENQKKFGFGNAIAQAHSHIIMPLAKELDIKIQTVWGIKSFENTFGRKPAGMWLPETAVDLKTLRILSEEGIKFTILGAHQCEKVKIPNGKWIKVDEASLDVSRPYKVSLGNGRYIWVFFFHRALSGELSFGDMLKNGDLMGETLIKESLRGDPSSPGLLLLACDGETFGHHHKFGEMGLSRAIKKMKLSNLVEIAPLEYILSLFEREPHWEAEIKENTSWSCAHGIKRWQEDCGCSTGGEPGWHQKWRAPLREAINFLIDQVDQLFERLSPKAFKDPLEALREHVNLFENEISRESFLERHIKEPKADIITALKLLELQRMKMFSQTSCGWFFSDISGIETVQILLYASRCMALYRELTGIDLEPKFKEILEKAPGNRPDLTNGKLVYEKLVTPQIYDKNKLLASLAFLSKVKGESFKIGTLRVNSQILPFPTINETAITSGRIKVLDLRTQEKNESFFINLSFKNLRQTLFLLDIKPEEERKVNETLMQINLASHSKEELLKKIEDLKPYGVYELDILPNDYREEVLEENISELKRKLLDVSEFIYRETKESIPTLREMGIEVHPVIEEAINLFFENLIEGALQKYSQSLWPSGYTNIIFSMIEEASLLGAKPKLEKINLALENRYKNLLNFYKKTGQEECLEEIKDIVKITIGLKLYTSLWSMQNETYKVIKKLDKKEIEKIREILSNLGFSNKLSLEEEG